MWTPVYYIRYAEFPAHVEGVTIPNDDGTFEIYINTLLCPARQKATLEHEIAHINADHFYDDISPIEKIEAQADRLNIGIDFSNELFPSVLVEGM